MIAEHALSEPAVFSADRVYRYSLRRVWDHGEGTCVFVCLNPSTADETADDPTVRRCVGFAKRWGYRQLVVLNAYAYRSTDPRVLGRVEDPVGPDNDLVIAEVCAVSSRNVCAWGVNADPDRAAIVRRLVGDACYLRLTKNGQPCHPLYLRGDLTPQEWSSSRLPELDRSPTRV